MSRPATTTADDALEVIRDVVDSRGFPPSLSELAELLECSKSTAKTKLDELVSSGRVRRAPGRARGIVLVPEGER